MACEQTIVVLGALGVLAAPVHKPPPARDWWAGLDRAEPNAAAAEGVRVLRVPARGRVRIAGGTFTMGSTAEQMNRALASCASEVLGAHCQSAAYRAAVLSEGAAHLVTISTFDLDATEVNVGDYARCVSAGACAPPDYSPADARFARAELPVTHVRWDDAVAYCRWTGSARLPTEAEWEYAARGPEGRIFPWGNVYNPHLANHGALAPDASDATDGFAGLAPVGSFPDGATPLGVLDMAGNAAEWAADVLPLDSNGNPIGYDAAAESDPKPKTAGGATHVIRGGSYDDGTMWLRGAARTTTVLPRHATVGFRCAADAR